MARVGGRFAQSSVINLPRPFAARRNRRLARSPTLVHSPAPAQPSLLHSLFLSQTHNIDDFLGAAAAVRALR